MLTILYMPQNDTERHSADIRCRDYMNFQVDEMSEYLLKFTC